MTRARRRRIHWLVLCSILLVGPALGRPVWPEAVSEEPEVVRLESGKTHHGELRFGEFDPWFDEYLVEVPSDAVVLVVELVCRRADLDLVLYREGEDDGYEDLTELELTAESEDGRERLSLDPTSEHPLEPGLYWIEVTYDYSEKPMWDNRWLDAVDYELTARIIRTREDGELRPGAPQRGQLDDASGRFRTYRIDVPRDAETLRIDVAEATADVDLYLRRRRDIVRYSEVRHFGAQLQGRESLVVTTASRPALRPGAWYLDVVEFWGQGAGPSSFTVHATFGPDPPPALLAIPPMPEPATDDGLSGKLRSVVEIYTWDGAGSGTFVSDDGIILTNAHVVADLGGHPNEEVVVGVTVDARSPSVERFRATVLAHDEERDLAFVQVTSGLYGQSLPADYRFPAFALGDPDAVRIGDRLLILGYPGTGGSKTKASITVTHGIVSGFERVAFGTLIKTDAEIHAGHSGGAVLDEAGRLIAVPSFSISEGISELSFLVPISAVPAAWWPEK